MDFGFYYLPDGQPDPLPLRARHGRIAVLLRHDRQREPDRELHRDRQGRASAKEYFGAWRTFPATCDWSWHETQPVGFNATYLGVHVFEGAYPYEDFRVVPGWGGSMFEALMPALFVPEEEWAPASWAVNHPLTITAQIHHGLVEAEYGYWGFSPANVPEGGYTEYGVDAIGMNPEGYKSNNDKTFVDRGFETARAASRSPTRHLAYTNGVSPRTRPSWPCAGRPTR